MRFYLARKICAYCLGEIGYYGCKNCNNKPTRVIHIK